MTPALIGAAVLAAGVAGGLGWLRLRWLTVTVAGPSMLPALRPGDRVLVRRTRAGRVQTGQVVVLDAESGPIIKRVAAAPGDPVPPGLGAVNTGLGAGPGARGDGVLTGGRVPPGRLVLLGDNPGRSVDSRQHGYYDAAHLVGVAVRPLPGRRP